MALIGGGGSPNVAGGGSNPSGTGTGLNYVGNHAFAYSGEVSVNDNETTMLDFTLGANQYFVGKVQFSYYGGTNQDCQHNIKINGELVQRYRVTQAYTEPDIFIPIIFVGGDRVQLTSKNATDSASLTTIVSVTGRIYA
jgi:hypothetical protein